MKLETKFNIFKFYDRVRESGMPIAWCSAFAPSEALLAAGVMPVFPENHAAMMGALSPERDQDKPYSLKAIDRSLETGLSAPKICSYALSDIGVLLGEGKIDSPIKELPGPDLFYACDSQCSVVERWGNEVQSILKGRGRDIPHYVLHAPKLVLKEEHSPEELAKFRADLEGHVKDICERFGTKFSEDRLREVVAESAKANKLWQRCLELAKRRPAPWSNTDAFAAMAPVVVERGLPECTEYYEKLLKELEARVEKGVSVVEDEKVRLVWDAIPIWPRKNWFADFAAERGAVFVASTYTHSWWFEFDPDNAMDSLCKRYAWNTMSRSGKWILDWTLGIVRDYEADGLVCHWNASCGIWNSYVKRRLSGYEEAGVPH
ncbi:MAG: 2-hydroxyacyl-CoA dehydratase family protein, partial [Elusimicrobiota bacterium]